MEDQAYQKPEGPQEQVELIPVYKRSYLEGKIKSLNKKAAKLGCEKLVLTFTDAAPKKVHEHPVTGQKLASPWVIDMLEAKLQYQIPTLEGYELIARLDLFGSEVLVSAVPGIEVPDAYKTLNRIDCDHCGHIRSRKHSILIHHIENDTYLQVGSTCVKDFFAGNDPRGFMFMASICFDHLVASIDEERAFRGSQDHGYEFSEIFTVTAAVIRQFGWTSKANELKYDGLKSTASRVLDNMFPYVKMPREEFVTITDEDKDMADKTLIHWEAVDPGHNDYLLNCTKLIKIGYVPNRFSGIACSMVAGYIRGLEDEKERAAKKAEQDALPESKHVGNLKERLKGIAVKVIFCKDIETQFGYSTIYSFRDAEGNIFKTFYSGSSWGCDVDDEVTITGTVKDHCEYNGQKQTMLSRVVVAQ